jgi:hypothetical protein
VPIFFQRMNARCIGVCCALATAALLVSESAAAQSTIRRPGDHPDYSVELEPRLLFAPFDPPGERDGSGLGFGLHLTIPIVRNGFIQTINNSVGIGFGVDWVHYDGSDVTLGYCSHYAYIANQTGKVCTEVGGHVGGPSNYFYFPLVMQWNFWLSDDFSVFGEPGFSIYYEKAEYESRSHVGADPILEAGGRWHFARWAALTLRMGYPVLSLGVSMLL